MTAVKPPSGYDKFGLPTQPPEGQAGTGTESSGRAPSQAHHPLPEGWVPIRDLHARHRGRILDHLLQLSERDRYLRFGAQVRHEQMARYVASIDFKRDEVFGIFTHHLQLVAMAHLAALPGKGPHGDSSRGRAMEFGVSVLPSARGRGLGMLLFRHAITHARNLHASHMMIHALTENAPMLRIAAKAGATIERDGPEAEAWLKLPPDTVATHIDSSLQSLGAELIYRVKYHLLHIGDWLRWLRSPG